MRRQKRESETQIIRTGNAAESELRRASAVGIRGRVVSFLLGPVLYLVACLSFLQSPDSVHAGDLKGKVRITGEVNNANAVVYIEKVDSTFAAPDTPVVMDQKNLMFMPEVLPVLAGTKVKFLNSDEVLHNVFTPSPCAGSFNLGSFPSGDSKSHVFGDAGCAALILCDIHPEMQAWVVVLQNPYFAVTDKAGNYVIKGVPAGTYNLKAWFGYYEAQTVRVVVPESGAINADFYLKQ